MTLITTFIPSTLEEFINYVREFYMVLYKNINVFNYIFNIIKELIDSDFYEILIKNSIEKILHIIFYIGFSINENTFIEILNNNFMVNNEVLYKNNVIKWLIYNNCPINNDICNLAAKLNNFDIIEYAIEFTDECNMYTIFHAIDGNNLDIIYYLINNVDKKEDIICEYAIEKNNIKCLQKLIKEGYSFDSYLLVSACYHNYHEIINWLITNKCPCDNIFIIKHILSNITFLNISEMLIVLKNAINYGCSLSDYLFKFMLLYTKIDTNKDILIKILIDNKCPIETDTCNIAASFGFFEIIKYGISKCDSNTIKNALDINNLDIVYYIIDNINKKDKNVCLYAINKRNLMLLKYLIQKKKYPWGKYLLVNAFLHNYYEIINWLIMKKCPCNSIKIIQYIVSNITYLNMSNMLIILQNAINYGCLLSEEACSIAALNGHSKVLELLLYNKFPSNTKTFCNAAFKGCLKCLKILYKYKCPMNPIIYYYICQNRRINAFKYLLSIKCPFDEYIYIYALFQGKDYFKFIHILKEKNYPLNIYASSYASIKGYSKILKWLLDNKCPYNDNIAFYSSMNGNLDCLIIAKKYNCALNEIISSTASLNGYFKILRWLLSNNCSYDINVCRNAVLNNHLDCLEVGLEFNCPCNETLTNIAVQNGNIVILEYLLSKGYNNDFNICKNCIINNNIECLKLALEYSCPYDYSLVNLAVLNKNIEIFDFLLLNEHPFDSNILCSIAALSGSLECLIIAREYGCSFDDNVFNHAFNNNHINILQWLLLNDYPFNNNQYHILRTNNLI